MVFVLVGVQQESAELSAVVEETVAGIRVVKSFANEDVENRRFEAENLKFLDTRRAGYKSEAFFSVGTTAFAQLITVVVIVAGAIRVLWQDTHNLAEGAGAAAMAALIQERAAMQGKTVAVILSGGNLDMSQAAMVLNGQTPPPL